MVGGPEAREGWGLPAPSAAGSSTDRLMPVSAVSMYSFDSAGGEASAPSSWEATASAYGPPAPSAGLPHRAASLARGPHPVAKSPRSGRRTRGWSRARESWL
eukprot:3088585-Alexandrium_andersonii.AAC.1